MKNFEQYMQTKRLASWAYRNTNGWLYLDDIGDIQNDNADISDSRVQEELLRRHGWRRAAEKLDKLVFLFREGL